MERVGTFSGASASMDGKRRYIIDSTEEVKRNERYVEKFREDHTWRFAVLALAAILVVQSTGILAPLSVAAAAPAAEDTVSLPRTITVVGVGEVVAAPDMGTATIGVEVTAPTVKEATTRSSNAKMDSRHGRPVCAGRGRQGHSDQQL